MADHLEHINRPLTEEERRLAVQVRKGAKRDFPPKALTEATIAPGVPHRMHEARTRRGLTRYAVGQMAGVPSTAVRAIEQGEDIPLSQFQAVATALGFALELVEQDT
jgi:ribosome-binding protein aMBF1 (putative translation factor)